MLSMKKKVRAGVLLYALLMAAIFSLFLQFYLNRVIATKRQNQAQLSSSQAYLMATLTQDLAQNHPGPFSFDGGKANYYQKDGQLFIKVDLDSGQTYHYQFAAKRVNTRDQQKNFSKEEKTVNKSKAKSSTQK